MARIVRHGVEDENHTGRNRSVADRNISRVLGFKRLGIRYDRAEAALDPLLSLAATLINLRRRRQAAEFRDQAKACTAPRHRAGNPVCCGS